MPEVISSWDYAYVCGELETWNGRNSLRIKQIRKLRDAHEPYHHLLGVMYEMQTIVSPRYNSVLWPTYPVIPAQNPPSDGESKPKSAIPRL